MIKKKPAKKTISTAAAVIGLSSAIRAVGLHVFVFPNGFAPGGVSGVATMIQHLTGGLINAGYLILLFNAPLLLLARKYLNRGYTVKSAITTVLTSLLLIGLEYAAPGLRYTDDRLLAALAAGVIGGAGLSLMYRIGGSTGGTDIIAGLLQRRSASSVQKWLLILDGLVVSASFFVYGFALTPVFLALVTIYVSSTVSETISRGLEAAFKFEIVTDTPDELAAVIMRELNRGVTCTPATGMYTGHEKSILVCIVRKRQIPQFRKILNERAAGCFVYATSAAEVRGKGFSSF
ncbi:MAG: YitT family protein [Firmicutes bacterium]|nr:YitT family protein [Bacillota bacterium]